VTAGRLRGDDGAGLVSSLGGVVAFLAFLLLAAHVIIGLYATSVVTDAASTGARRVAGAAVDDERAAAGLAEPRIREALGSMGAYAAISWRLGTDSIEVTVRVERPGLVAVLGGSTIERTVTVRREALR
jgi:hypothetical protein